MSTLSGRIVETDTKQSKKGNTYHRLKIQTADGQSTWWTYFGNLHGQYMNAECAFVLKPMGDGQIIDDYHITADGSPPYAAPAAPGAAPVQAPAGNVVTKDTWIFAEVVFQHWIDNAGPVQDADAVKDMVAHSVSAALFANEVFARYSTQGIAEARKLIKAALHDSPEHRVAEMQEQATQASTSPASLDGEIDDDIPF